MGSARQLKRKHRKSMSKALDAFCNEGHAPVQYMSVTGGCPICSRNKLLYLFHADVQRLNEVVSKNPNRVAQ